ncbi:transporter substrate-binding domain-containing protein [Gemmiger sp.]
MKLKNTMALAMAAVLAAGLTACGGSADTSAASPAADSTAADSTATAETDTTAAPDGDGDPTTLTVAMECAYAPYNWTQSDDSNGAVEIRGSSDYAYGYDVMMAKKIADALGQKVQIVKLDWDSLIPAVMSGDVDCVIAGQSITAERAAQVDFSDPYYYASIVTLTKKDSAYANATSVADLAGATATSQLGTIWYDTCLPQIENANILPAQETAPAMLVALNSGACDIVVTDHPTGQAALTAYPDLVMLDFGGGDKDFQVSDEDINIGISMKKGNTTLKDAINSVLATMTTDDYNTMMDEAISVQPLSE